MTSPADTTHHKPKGKSISWSRLLRAAQVGTRLTKNTVTVGTPILALGLTKLLSPQAVKTKIDQHNIKLANQWIGYNNQLIDRMLPHTQWLIDIDPDLELNTAGRYILISNHQSWVDTTVTQYIGLDRMPLTRFFTKYELIYIPFAGQAFKILGFPMMKRHTKAQIAANPSLKMRDLQEARRACQQLVSQPYTLLNYLEGTRFTPQKHQSQQSPYRHLLKPKAGGLALALHILQGKVDALIDLSIVYLDGIPGYGEFWLDQPRRIAVELRKITIPDWVNTANYEDDEEYRQRFQQWVDEIWQQKDQRIDAIKQRYAVPYTPAKPMANAHDVS